MIGAIAEGPRRAAPGQGDGPRRAGRPPRQPRAGSAPREEIIAVGLLARGVTRIVVAGGETSGSVVTALGIGGGLIGPEAAPCVPWILSDRVGLLLKSGNFGGPGLLIEAAAADPIPAPEGSRHG